MTRPSPKLTEAAIWKAIRASATPRKRALRIEPSSGGDTGIPDILLADDTYTTFVEAKMLPANHQIKFRPAQPLWLYEHRKVGARAVIAVLDPQPNSSLNSTPHSPVVYIVDGIHALHLRNNPLQPRQIMVTVPLRHPSLPHMLLHASLPPITPSEARRYVPTRHTTVT